MLQPGQHALELNPYWKDGGTGLPENKPEATAPDAGVAGLVGDGGVGWWRKAYSRCEEQAKETGKTLEQVATERYGVNSK